MFIVLPIGHENDKVRRLPWVSFFIMAACIIAHIYVTIEIHKQVKELERVGKELVNYYFQHPYLELDEETKKLLFGERNAEQFEEMLDIYREAASRQVHIMEDEEQEELDQLAKDLKNSLDEFPYRKWGFIPARKSYMALLTYMFIHGGWLHLIGNLLFLYLTGPFIEDVWGRPIFTGFYVMAGVFSAFMYAQHYPDFSGPLIGASGAIAGVMGAFLIRYFTTKIKFFYIFFFIFRGTFKAPAWLMMPLWLLLEVMNGKAIDAINPGGGGAAHWAHVWGFIFGVVVAWGMKAFKVEEKYIHPKIESQIQFVDEGFRAHDEALKLRLAGNVDGAFALLLDAARKHPANQDVVESLWNLGNEIGRETESAEFMVRLIENEVRHDKIDLALNHYMSLRSRIPEASISLTYKFALMKYLVEQRAIGEAEKLANELLGQVSLSSPPGLLHDFASVALEISPSIVQQVIDLCIQHPEIPEGQKDKLKADLETAQKNLQTAAAVSNMQNVTTVPGSQGATETQMAPDIPMSLRSRVTPETPVVPESPMAPDPAVAPSGPTVPENPKGPGTPASLEPPMTEHSPLAPERPMGHESPAAPDPSATPGGLITPENPALPGKPEAPGTSPASGAREVPGGAAAPGSPRESAIPEAKGSPAVPDMPVRPESRAEPGSKIAPETPASSAPGISERSPSAQKSIRVYKATPLEIKDDKLGLNTEEFGQKLLPFGKVKAIAVAEISSPQDLPYELIDLFLDDPKSDAPNPKAVRLFTTGFNSRKFFPDMQDQNEALKAFLSTVLEQSGAVPYPDRNSVLLNPPQIFGSIMEYERSILP